MQQCSEGFRVGSVKTRILIALSIIIFILLACFTVYQLVNSGQEKDAVLFGNKFISSTTG